MEKRDFKELLDDQTKVFDQKIDAKLNAQSKVFDQKIDARFEEQTKEIKRHQKMLLEEFDSRLTIVAEVQSEHTQKHNDHMQKIDALMEMVSMNTDQLEFIKGMLKRKVDVDEHELLVKRVSLLEKKLRVSGT